MYDGDGGRYKHAHAHMMTLKSFSDSLPGTNLHMDSSSRLNFWTSFSAHCLTQTMLYNTTTRSLFVHRWLQVAFILFSKEVAFFYVPLEHHGFLIGLFVYRGCLTSHLDKWRALQPQIFTFFFKPRWFLATSRAVRRSTFTWQSTTTVSSWWFDNTRLTQLRVFQQNFF